MPLSIGVLLDSSSQHTTFFLYFISAYLRYLPQEDTTTDAACNDFLDFIKAASCDISYNADKEAMAGFAEGMLDQDEWEDDNNFRNFVTFVSLCVTSVTPAAETKELVHKKMSEVITVAGEAFAFLILENNIKRWTWLARDKLYCEKNDEKYNVKDTPLPALLYQKNITQKKENAKMIPAGQWMSYGRKRYNQLVRCVMDSRQSPGRIEYEGRLLEHFREESGQRRNNDNTMPQLGEGFITSESRGAAIEGNRKRKIDVVVIDLLEI